MLKKFATLLCAAAFGLAIYAPSASACPGSDADAKVAKDEKKQEDKKVAKKEKKDDKAKKAKDKAKKAKKITRR